MELEFNHVSVCSVVQIEGRVMTLELISSARRLHSMKLCNTQISPCLTYPLQFGCLFCSLWSSSFFTGVIGLHCQVQNTIVLLGLRRNQSQFHLLQHSKSTPRTVLITENDMKSTKVFHSSTVCSTLNRSMKVTSFRQCNQCPSPSVGVFAEWAAFAVEDVKGYALLDTGASRSVGGYMMVQHVIDCLSRDTGHHGWSQQILQWVSLSLEEKRLIQRPESGCHFQVRGMSVLQCTSILLGLDMLREFGLVINTDSAHCYSTKLRCRILVTVLPSGHLALALTQSGSFETTGKTTTLVEETVADMTAARDSAPSLRVLRATMGTQNRYQDCLEV